MASIYLANNINYRRVYIAVIVSVIAHMALATVFLNKNNVPIYLDNGIQAIDNPRISLSISAMKPIQKAELKPEVIKPLPVSAPIEKVKEAALEEVIEDIINEDKTQEQIPIVENATFKGKRSPPIYPKRALMLKQEGVVLLKALIDINGDIKDVQIITSSGYTILDKSAIDAVRKWKFKPSMIDGKPSISWVKVPVEFIIK
jgi:TonB family protein